MKNIMKTLLITALAVASSSLAFATLQIPDKIIYDGKKYKLLSNPLESYFEKNPGKRPEDTRQSTALWRGYVATFEIKDNQLYVKDIEIEIGLPTYKNGFHIGPWKSVMKKVFPKQKLVKADWVTELLIVQTRKVAGHGNIQEYDDILLEIDKGKVIKTKTFKNAQEFDKFRKKQFQEYRKTDEYKHLRANYKKDMTDHSDEFIDSIMRETILGYISKILVD